MQDSNLENSTHTSSRQKANAPKGAFGNTMNKHKWHICDLNARIRQFDVPKENKRKILLKNHIKNLH